MLEGLFRPRAVAVIGASNNPLSIGHMVVRNLLDHGFKGAIFPINPGQQEIAGLRCFASVLKVPAQIDLVNISIHHRLVPSVLEECGQKGVKFAIVHSAGYKETGSEGAERERAIVAIGRRYGMRLFGPNSQGVQNSDPEVCCYANFTFVPMRPGNISIIAQGGGMGEMLKLHLHKAGLGHRLYCSYGNECDLSMPELLAYFGQDPATRVIMMQTESFKDPQAFLEVARKITPRIPILAIKAGRTPEGSAAVSSHTGAMADQSATVAAMYRRAGVVELRDTDEMIKAAIALSMQPIPTGRRIGIITNTGGPGIQAVDEAVEQGLLLAQWSEAGRQQLAESLSAESSIGNPVDVTATAGPNHFFSAAQTLLAERDVDMVLCFLVTAPFVDLDGVVARLQEATAGADKPLVAVVETSDRWAGLVTKLREGGIPVYEFAEDGARALAVAARYAELRERISDPPPELLVDSGSAESVLARHRGRGTYIPQADAFTLLSAYGIPVPKLFRIRTQEDLAPAVARIGFPCVLKVDSIDVVHKAEAGGVALDLAAPEDLAAAFTEMRQRFSGDEVSFILLEQKPVGRELVVGVTGTRGLGALVMFGLGGVFVETLQDVIFGLAPLGRSEAQMMIRTVRAHRLLEGTANKPGVDLAAVENVLLRVSKLAADYPEISELDINPLLAYPTGRLPAAVDVRLRVS